MGTNSKARVAERASADPARSIMPPRNKEAPGQSPPASTPTASTHTDVSIISNSRLLCDGFEAMLVAYTDLYLMGNYSGALPTTLAIANSPHHVVLIDAAVGQDGLVAWTRYWREQLPPAYVVILESDSNTEIIIACIEAGASGYTMQGASVREVVDTIHRVQQGLMQCSLEIIAELLTRRTRQPDQRAPLVPCGVLLTPRELDVLCCMADGYSNRDIAARLVIEVHTVKYHVHNILEKLKVSRRGDAARLALEQGWVEGSRSGRPAHD